MPPSVKQDTDCIKVGHPCTECGHLVRMHERECSQCHTDAVAARLISHGAGVVGKGAEFELRPMDYRIGRDKIHNDIVIGSNLVARREAHIRYESDGFVLIDTGNGRCKVNGEPVPGSGARLQDGDVLTVAFEQLEFQETGQRLNRDGDERNLQAISALLSGVNDADDMVSVFDEVLDAILIVSGLERGFGYLPENWQDADSGLEIITGRATQARPWEPERDGNHGFCQELLQASFNETYPIIILRGADGTIPDNNAIGFRAVVSIPLCVYDPETGKRCVRGLLYADSLSQPLDTHIHAEATLGIIAQIATMSLLDLDEEIERDTIRLTNDGDNDQLKQALITLRDDIDADDDIGPASKIALWQQLDNIIKLTVG